MQMRRVLAFVLVLAGPAFAGVSPEFQLGVPDSSSAPFVQAVSSLEGDVSGYFAVWEDSRGGPGVQRIFGSRLDFEGRALDPFGIPVSTAAGESPQVVRAGSNYLVIWRTRYSAAVARVDSAGHVLDAPPKTPIASPTDFTGAVATNGTVAAVVSRYQSRATVTLLNENADSIRVTKLPQADFGDFDSGVLAAWNGTSFVVAQIYTKASGDALARISFMRPDGVITSSFKTAAVLIEGAYSLAAIPDRVLLTSARRTTGFNAWMFSDSGVQIGGRIQMGATWNNDPVAITTDGETFVVVWQDWIKYQPAPSMLAARIDRDGVSPPAAVVVRDSTDEYQPSIASSAGGRLLLAWTHVTDANEQDIVALPLSVALEPGGSQSTVSLSASNESRASLGWNGSLWLAVWQEHRGGGSGRRLLARRFTPKGEAIDPTPFEVADLASLSYAESPQTSVASDGHDFAIVWRQAATLFLRRLSGTTTWLDDSPTLVTTDAGDLGRHALAWNGSKYFLVYARGPSTDPSAPYGVMGIAISKEGQVDPPQQISPERTNTRDAVLARLGNQWLVAWTTYIPPLPCEVTCPPDDTDVLGARVAFDGTVIDTAPIHFSMPHTNSGPRDHAEQPSIASAGETALVAWAADAEIRGVRVEARGFLYDTGVGNGTRLVEPTSYQLRWPLVDAAWDGRDFLLLVSTAGGYSGASWARLYRLRGGIPLTTAGQGEQMSLDLTMPQDADSAAVSLATRPGGGAFMAYQRVEYDARVGGVGRLFARTIAPRPRTRLAVR